MTELTNLERYRRMLHTVTDLEDKLDALRSQSARVISSAYSTTGGSHAGDGRGPESRAIRLADAETRYISVLGKLADLRQMVDEELDQIDDDLTREVLTGYYVDGMTAETIAKRLEISERHIHRLRAAGIDFLKGNDYDKQTN